MPIDATIVLRYGIATYGSIAIALGLIITHAPLIGWPAAVATVAYLVWQWRS